MISKAKAVRGSTAGIDYIMKEEKNSYELCRQDVIGENGKEILAEFRQTQALNETCKNNTFTIVLSPSNDQIHSPQELRKFTQSHLKNLGLENHQYIAYVHQNTKATHVHIIANRIDYQGKALNDSYIGFKAQNSAEKIAKENGLTTAKEVRIEKAMNKEFDQLVTRDIKKEIYKDHNFAVKQSNSFADYVQIMHDKGYKIEPTINKSDKLQGFRIYDKQSELTFKASEIGKECRIPTMIEKGVSFEKLSQQLEQVKPIVGEFKTENPIELFNPKQAKETNLSLPKIIEKPLEKVDVKIVKTEVLKAHNFSGNQSHSFADYIKNMNDKGFKIELSISKGDKLQGFKITDVKNGLTFKASDISPNCGIKDLILNKNLNFQDLGKQLNSVKDIVSKGSNLNPVTLSNPLLKVLDLSFQIASKLIKGFDNGIGMGL